MLDTYIDFINSHIKDINSLKVLLAVSGGVDSMVMLDLSMRAGLQIAVAHVNHGMRGESSDKDASLINDFCLTNNILYHQYTFLEDQKVKRNFQEKARNIRYEWWNQLCEEHDYDLIFTAHHMSDSVETFFINLTRGAGLSGLTSIPIHNRNIFRPLSKFTKKEIEEYAENHKIEYRVDESNNKNDYKRNVIRNKWIPYLTEQDENIQNGIAQSITNLRKEKELLSHFVEREMHKYVTTSSSFISVDINQLSIDNQLVKVDLLYQYLKMFGFTYDTCIKCFGAITGAIFRSDTHELLKNRDVLLLRQKKVNIDTVLIVENFGSYNLGDATVLVSDQLSEHSFAVANLSFPICLRKWQPGDKFKPNGMHGKSKKVKDFLTDLKLDKWTKESVYVIVHNDSIAAVLPYRVAQGYKDENLEVPFYFQFLS